MNKVGPDSSAMQEELYELRRFLSDEIAPLTVADSVSLLLENDPDIMAMGIRSWVEAQLLRQQSAVSISNYFFHALKKIRVVGDLNLVSKEQLAKYLVYLSQYAVNCCPVEERQVLASNLSQLEGANASLDAAPVNFFYQLQPPQESSQQIQSFQTTTPARDYNRETPNGGRRFDMLLERLEDRTGGGGASYFMPPPPAFGTSANAGFSGVQQTFQSNAGINGALAARAFAIAAGNSQNEAELEQYLQRLGHNSLQNSSQNIFMTLGQNLPDWAILSNPEPGAKTGLAAAQPLPRSDSLLDAMERMVSLATDPNERAKRFNEIVQTAILQFNEGWLGRAASMLDTAQGLVAAKEVEASTGKSVRQKGHEKISYDRLRAYVESPHQRPLLRKVLGFFDDLGPDGLLAKLRVEPVRNRRRLIMMLLEIHGADARAAVFKALQESAGERDEKIWYFQRNLLHLMHLIPRENGVCSDDEINTIVPFTKLNHPSQVAREALSNLGLKNDKRAEKPLIECLKEYEDTLLNIENTPFQPSEIRLLLDRIVLVLVRVATPAALRAVVEHGLKRQPLLGDTLARLAELGNLDLSPNGDLVEKILFVLAGELPNKLMSMFVKKDDKDAINLVKSLTGTPSPTVRRFFAAVVKKHSNRDFGKLAAEALASFGHVETQPAAKAETKAETKAEKSVAPAAAPPAPLSSIHSPAETESAVASSVALSGDLAIFGLPSLLQNLADSRLSGVLTLKDQIAETIGTITLDEGKIRSSQAKRLRNVDAVYQLLQKPLAGTFQFVQFGNFETEENNDGKSEPLELIPVLLEGMRRYDELQASCAVVPDNATFTLTEVEPKPHEEERDENLIKAVWESAKAGATAAECENQLIIDSYRVRRLLSHWVESGALKLVVPEKKTK